MTTSTFNPGASTNRRAQPAPAQSQKTVRAGMLGIVTAASLAACSAFGGKAAEEPAYDVVTEDGNFQVREYGGYAVAETMVSPPYDSASRTGFGRLVRYISGANSGSRKIQMTAPVELEPRGEKITMTAPVLLGPVGYSGASQEPGLTGAAIETWRVAFVLPQGYTAENSPVPSNPAVMIRDVAPRRVATVRFGGLLGDRKAEQQRKLLAAWLEARGMEHMGDWRVAGYNPPWAIPPLRRNEVLVTLR